MRKQAAHQAPPRLPLLIDTGPLLALIDKRDAAHQQVADAFARLPEQTLLTTWACITEAMYMLGVTGGHSFQEILWGYLADELVTTHDLTASEQVRMRALMTQYADTPMDLADASLVAIAESLGARRIFTLDSDFYIYRLADGSMLEVVR